MSDAPSFDLSTLMVLVLKKYGPLIIEADDVQKLWNEKKDYQMAIDPLGDGKIKLSVEEVS